MSGGRKKARVVAGYLGSMTVLLGPPFFVDALEREPLTGRVDLSVREFQELSGFLVIHVLEVPKQEATGIVLSHDTE